MQLKMLTITISSLVFLSAATSHSAYDLVEWIQANPSGNAWIDSGVTAESEDVSYEVQWRETAQESLTALFGATAWSGSTALYGTVGYHSSAGKIAFWTGRSSSLCEFTDITANVTNTMSVVVQNKQISVTKNGTTKGPVAYTGYVTNREDIAILADRDRTKGTTGMNGAKEICKYTRLFRWKMADNGVVKRIMLPAVDRNSGKAGLVDLLTGGFFGSAGPGEFTCGAVVTNAATQFTDGQKAALEAADGTLVVEGTPENYGAVSPAYGIATGIANGSNIAMQVTSPEFTYLTDTERVTCTGAVVRLIDVAIGAVTNAVPYSGRSFNYVHAGRARVEWLWKTQFLTAVTNTGGGTVSVPGNTWGDCDGGTLTLTATPVTTSGYVFSHWEGDVADTVSGAATDATITLDHARARSVTAVFKRVGYDLVAPTFTGDCVYTEDGANSVFKFTNVTQSATFTIAKNGFADILVVGGGASGGRTMGGGGGGGQVVYHQNFALTGGETNTITVGAGGAAQTTGQNSGNDGTTSSFGSLVAAAGGGKGNGWSGGNTGPFPGGGNAGGGSNGRNGYTADEGSFSGGKSGGTSVGAGGGGGGAGGVGCDGSASNVGGEGGPGFECGITGTMLFYGAGGGGGVNWGSINVPGLGGSGIGGKGGSPTNAATAGRDGTGSGGGGGTYQYGSNENSGRGGSGVVIIRVSSYKRNMLVVTGHPDAVGTADPAYGCHIDLSGSRECTVNEVWTNAASDTAYTRTGYMLSVTTPSNETTHTYGTDASVTYVHTPDNHATLTWLFRRAFKFGVQSAIGSADPAAEWWCVENDAVTYTAQAAEGYAFVRWIGDVPDSVTDITQSTITFFADRPRVLKPVFTLTGSGAYYVAPSGGDNTNDGLSPETAFATITGAHSAVSDGDTILLLPGMHITNYRISISKAVTIKPSTGKLGDAVLAHTSDSHNIYGDGTFFYINNKDAVARDLVASNIWSCGSGGYQNTRTFTVAAGTLSNCRITGCRAGGGSWQGHRYLYVSGANAVADRCVVEKTSPRSISYFVGDTSVFVDNGGTVKNCVIRDNRGFGSSGLEIGSKGKAYNNTIVGNMDNQGITGYQNYDLWNSLRAGLAFYGQNAVNLGYNNVFVDNHNPFEFVGHTVNYDFLNAKCLTRTFADRTGIGAEQVFGDPVFRDPKHGDYRPMPGSCLVGAGTEIASVTNDFIGTPRASGALTLGAYGLPDEFSCGFTFGGQSPLGEGAFDLGEAITFRGYVHNPDAAVGESYTYAWTLTPAAGGASVTAEGSEFSRSDLPGGNYAVSLVVTRSSDDTTTSFSRTSDFLLVGSDAVYVKSGAANPVFPYATEETATDDLAAAYDALVTRDDLPGTLHVGAGTFNLAKQLVIEKPATITGLGYDRSIICQTGKVERVIYIGHKDAVVERVGITGGNRTTANQAYNAQRWPYRGEKYFGGGAGVYIASEADRAGTVRDCRIYGNTFPGGFGGQIHAAGGLVERCVIDGNGSAKAAAAYGGGIRITGKAVVRDCLIKDCGATSAGGGVFAYYIAGARMVNCTVTDNFIDSTTASTASGPGFCLGSGEENHGGRIELVNNVIWGNRLSSASTAPAEPTLTDNSDILIAQYSKGISRVPFLNNLTAFDTTGYELTKYVYSTNSIVANPRFRNAGVTPFKPTGGSPCINAGVLEDWMPTAIDLLGNRRVVNNLPDIGCYEFNSYTLLLLR